MGNGSEVPDSPLHSETNFWNRSPWAEEAPSAGSHGNHGSQSPSQCPSNPNPGSNWKLLSKRQYHCPDDFNDVYTKTLGIFRLRNKLFWWLSFAPFLSPRLAPGLLGLKLFPEWQISSSQQRGSSKRTTATSPHSLDLSQGQAGPNTWEPQGVFAD